MTVRARMAALGAAFAVLEAGAGLWAVISLGPARIAYFLLACAVATTAVTALLWRLLGTRPDGEARGGGGAPSGDDPPPAWWPEFDRDFRRHVREKRAPSKGPGEAARRVCARCRRCGRASAALPAGCRLA